MLGSWLSEIQKTLDSVSGLAEKLEEFPDADEKNVSESGDALHLSGSEFNEMEGGNMSHPMLTGVEVSSQKCCSTDGDVPPLTTSVGATEVGGGAAQLPSACQGVQPCGTSPTLEQRCGAAPNERDEPHDGKVEQTPATCLSEHHTPTLQPGQCSAAASLPATDDVTLAEEADCRIMSGVGHHPLLVGCESEDQCRESLQGGQVANTASTIGQNAAEAQLLRFQQMLAREMEISQDLRAENKSLAEGITSLQKEVSALRHLRRNGVDKERMASLEREGVELSEQLGKERERNKHLLEKKVEAERRVASLELQLQKGAADYDGLQRTAAARQLECESAQRQVKELASRLEERENHVQELQCQLSNHKAELDHRRSSTSDVVESLRREKEVVVSSFHRNQMEYEFHIQQLEKKLAQAEYRADQAETRLVELERDSLGPLRELRAALDSAEQQKKQLLQETVLAAEECTTLRRDSIATIESYKQQLAGAQNELAAVIVEKDTSIRELLQWKGKCFQIQKELADALSRVAEVEAANEQVKPLPHQVKQFTEAASCSGQSCKGSRRSPSLVVREPSMFSSQPLTPLDACGGKNRFSVFSFHSGSTSTDAVRCGRERMEKELVRQAVEIENLRRYKDEAEELRKTLTALSNQHDLLMQMYGQLQEELQGRIKSEDRSLS